MATAKDIHVAPISAKDAAAIVKRVHYSGKVVNNSQLHMGVFYNGRLEGALSFGPSLDKRKIVGLVDGTGWNEFLELNRMAFTDALPRNSESRALSVAMKLIKKHAPQVKWIITFADGTQCGDGTIYRAAGFALTGVRTNHHLFNVDGEIIVGKIAWDRGWTPFWATGEKDAERIRKATGKSAEVLEGFQLRYIYFIDPSYRARLTVPELPYSKIAEMGAGMYRGEKR